MNFFSPKALLEAMTPHTLFARLSIARKMLLGYMLLAALSVAVVISGNLRNFWSGTRQSTRRRGTKLT